MISEKQKDGERDKGNNSVSPCEPRHQLRLAFLVNVIDLGSNLCHHSQELHGLGAEREGVGVAHPGPGVHEVLEYKFKSEESDSACHAKLEIAQLEI